METRPHGEKSASGFDLDVTSQGENRASSSSTRHHLKSYKTQPRFACRPRAESLAYSILLNPVQSPTSFKDASKHISTQLLEDGSPPGCELLPHLPALAALPTASSRLRVSRPGMGTRFDTGRVSSPAPVTELSKLERPEL